MAQFGACRVEQVELRVICFRIVRRYTALGYSDYVYEDGTEWLVREIWHSAISGNTFDLTRYQYTSGRPSRVEIANVSSDMQTLNGYTTYYLQSNWHGDTVVWVASDGGGINATTLTTDPWGVYTSDTLQYYLWNGGWGYMYFSPLKLYYVHGRWYNPETALWLSPDEKGEYLYGSGQDAINWVWTRLCRRSGRLCDTIGTGYQNSKKIATNLSEVDWGAPFDTTGLEGDWYALYLAWFFDTSPSSIGVWSYEGGEPLVTITSPGYIHDLRNKPHYRKAINQFIQEHPDFNQIRIGDSTSLEFRFTGTGSARGGYDAVEWFIGSYLTTMTVNNIDRMQKEVGILVVASNRTNWESGTRVPDSWKGMQLLPGLKRHFT